MNLKNCKLVVQVLKGKSLTTSFSFLRSDSFYRRDCRDGDRNISLVLFFLHRQYVACQNFPFPGIPFSEKISSVSPGMKRETERSFVWLSSEAIEVDFKEVTLSLQGVRAKFISAKKDSLSLFGTWGFSTLAVSPWLR